MEHSDGIECITKLDEDSVLVGCSDGSVRAMHVLPNKELRRLGYHSRGAEEDALSIESMAVNHSGTLLATLAHDERIQLWDLQRFLGDEEGSLGVSSKKHAWYNVFKRSSFISSSPWVLIMYSLQKRDGLSVESMGVKHTGRLLVAHDENIQPSAEIA